MPELVLQDQVPGQRVVEEGEGEDPGARAAGVQHHRVHRAGEGEEVSRLVQPRHQQGGQGVVGQQPEQETAGGQADSDQQDEVGAGVVDPGRPSSPSLPRHALSLLIPPASSRFPPSDSLHDEQ